MALGISWDAAARVAPNATRRPCACGEDIVCIDDPDGIAIGVRAHQRTPEHLAWRSAHREFDHASTFRRPIGGR